MEFEGKIYDVEGKEIPVREGYTWVIGKDMICQVELDNYEIKMNYKPPEEPLRAEWGSSYNPYEIKIQNEDDEKKKHQR